VGLIFKNKTLTKINQFKETDKVICCSYFLLKSKRQQE